VFVAVCRLELHVPAARSLKEKRAVLQSLSARIRNQYHVSVAEIDAQDSWNLAVLGIAVVSNDGGHAREMIDHIVSHLDHMRMDADPGAVDVEIIEAL
jgi:uncharacterized protein YlxP (DUF503 family)